MSAEARRAFLERLAAFRGAVGSPLIVDRAPKARTHNRQARLLRNGLAVVGFSLLEDFLRSRTAEVLEWLTARHISYQVLPAKLQRAVTRETVQALRFRYELERKAGPNLPFLSDAGTALASLTAPTLVFSPLALGWRGSNLQTDEVGEMLGAFEVKDGWENVQRVAGRAGLGFLTARDSFGNALAARHEAAHSAAADIQPTDLQYFARDALGIALGYDAVVSRAARLVVTVGTAEVPSGLLQDGIRIRLLQRQPHGWIERLDSSPTTIRRGSSFHPLAASARTRSRPRGDVLVVRDTFGAPYRWETIDVP